MTGAFSEAYSGIAKFGQGYALVGAVGATVLGAGLVGFGFWLNARAKSEVQANGKTTGASSCGLSIVKGNSQTICSTPVAYNDELGRRYERVLDTHQAKYGANEPIGVFYQVGDAGSASASRTPSSAGFIVMVVAAVVVVLAWLSWYLTKKSKVFAAASGLHGIRNMVFR